MKQLTKVHRIDTDDSIKGNIFKSSIGGDLVFNFYDNTEWKDCQYYHLYHTVSQDVEEIKEGDWFIWYGNMVINQAEKSDLVLINNHFKNGDVAKIIATTDPKLTKFKTMEMDGKLIAGANGKLPQISQADIEKYCDNPYDECYVEYESPEAVKDKHPLKKSLDILKEKLTRLKVNSDNTINIFPLEEKITLPINIHEGIYNTHVEIIDGVIHVKPNPLVEPRVYTKNEVDLLISDFYSAFCNGTGLEEERDKWLRENL